MATERQMEESLRVCWTGPCTSYGDAACVCALDRGRRTWWAWLKGLLDG